MATSTSLEQDTLIARFLEHCHQKTYAAKQLIIKEGDPSNDLFYIITGSVTVMVEDDKGHEIVLAYLNAGEFFGEIGLFEDGNNRTAFVRAKTKSEISKISYEKVKTLHNIFPDLVFSSLALTRSGLATKTRMTQND